MSSIPFNPQPPDEQFSRLVTLRNSVQQQQLQQQQLRQNEYNLGQTQATNEAYRNAIKVDENGQPHFDADVLTQHLSNAGYGSAVPEIMSHIGAYEKAQADSKEAQNKVQTASKDSLGYIGRAIQQANYDPQLAQTFLEHGLQDQTLQPQAKQQLQQLRQAVSQNPALIKQFADNAVTQSPKMQELLNQQEVARIRNKPAEGELALGDKVPQLNQALTQRWQVLNPGQSLPAPYTLPQNATQKDFDRIDKLMQQTESARGTKAQQDTANAMRQQTMQLAQQSAQERQEKEGLQPVIGTDPKTGKDVLVSAAEAKQMNLTGTMKAGEQDVSKAQSARHWIPLATSQGDTPDQMGILQLIDKLDSEGKLGTVSSRWNDFLAGKVGAGDPEFTALRAKMGLSSTLLMNAHVGSRGGSYMLEHFEDLANAKKMNAQTLRTGVLSELDYVKSRAMMPQRGGQTGSQAGGTEPTATGPNGHKIAYRGGKWVDAQTGAPVQ